MSVMQTSATELVEEMIALLRRDLAADRRQFWAATGLVTVDDLHVLKKEGLALPARALAATAARCHGDVRRAVSSIAHRHFEAARRNASAGA